MTGEQFDTIARMIRANGPSRLAARLVLVDGLTQADAAHAHKVEPNALNNSVRRYREFDRAIREAYGLNGGALRWIALTCSLIWRSPQSLADVRGGARHTPLRPLALLLHCLRLRSIQ